MTADENNATGWNHSVIMTESEPKPIQTGAIIHSLCITHGLLRTYKLFVRVYGGRSDEDVETNQQNTTTLQMWLSLYDIMLGKYKGKGHRITMDSAYIVNTMAFIDRHKWKLNIVGAALEN